MNKAKLLISIIATALMTQVAAVAQQLKFRTALDRAAPSEQKITSDDNARTGSSVQHQHRRGGASPRFHHTSDAPRERIIREVATSDLIRKRVGPASKARTVVVRAEPNPAFENREAVSQRGPVPKRNGRR